MATELSCNATVKQFGYVLINCEVIILNKSFMYKGKMDLFDSNSWITDTRINIWTKDRCRISRHSSSPCIR